MLISLKIKHDMLRANELCRLFCTNKEYKEYQPHRKFMIVCYTDSQLINKKCLTAIQIQYFKLYFSIKHHMQSNKLPILHLITSTCQSE